MRSIILHGVGIVNFYIRKDIVVKSGSRCPDCGGELKHYDYVRRVVKTKRGEKTFFSMERVYCKSCRKVHRVLTDDIIPYKQYEREVIEGVVEGLIDSDTLGFENYPSEKQMDRWRDSQKFHAVL